MAGADGTCGRDGWTVMMDAQPRHQSKVVDRATLLKRVAAHRRDGRTIAHCHGCFDMVHPGHVRHLEFASRQADILVVTITGDADIHKGDQRPYIPQELRAESLAALAFVDYVSIDDAPSACDVLRDVRPDVYVKGREYETSSHAGFLAERAVVEQSGGKVIFSSGDVVFSSSRLLSRLPRDRSVDDQRVGLFRERHKINVTTMRDLLKNMRGRRVVVIGDIVLDRYVFCDARDVAGEAPVLALKQLDEVCYVGGAAIVARHATAMGARTQLVAAGAVDHHTRTVLTCLKNERIDFHPAATRERFIQKTRFLVEEAKQLKVESGDPAPLDSVAERAVSRHLETISTQADAVIFCDFGYGVVTASLLERVLPCLRSNVPVLAADVSGARGTLVNFRNVDLLCPTERELRRTLNDFDAGLSAVAWRLMETTQAKHLICTLGKRGLVAFDRATQDQQSPDWSARLRSEHLPSLADRCVDRLGCGDALLSVATLALCAKGSLAQAAYLGSVASAIELATLGNEPIDAGQLERWLVDTDESAPTGETATARTITEPALSP